MIENKDHLVLDLAKEIEKLKPGFIANPFTGRDEKLRSQTEIQFLAHCIRVNEPITADHGLIAGWEDSKLEPKVYRFSFRHRDKSIIYIFDDFLDADGSRRLKGIKDWCDQHKFIALFFKRPSNKFEVIGGHYPQSSAK